MFNKSIGDFSKAAPCFLYLSKNWEIPRRIYICNLPPKNSKQMRNTRLWTWWYHPLGTNMISFCSWVHSNQRVCINYMTTWTDKTNCIVMRSYIYKLKIKNCHSPSWNQESQFHLHHQRYCRHSLLSFWIK